MSDATDAERMEPFEEQREMYDLLSQETRHLVLQYVLAHPSHLPSLDELAYLIPKNKAAIRDQVKRLESEGIVRCYDHPPNEDARDLPSQFYGLTEHGVAVLDEYNYLRGMPVARALYDSTRLSDKATRHQEAPRPELPDAVDEALELPDDSEDFEELAEYIRTRNTHTQSLDDQVALAKALYRDGIGPDHEGMKSTELREELDTDLHHRSRTVLENLVEIDVVDRVKPAGPDVFAISERTDEIVDGRVKQEAQRNLEALVEHVDDELQAVEVVDSTTERRDLTPDGEPSVALSDGAGTAIRSILAKEFGVAPEEVIGYLRSGDPVDRLDAAVDAIESSEEVAKSQEYGRILFVNPAYRYRLGETAVDLL